MAHSKLYKLLPPTVDSILPLCTDGDSHAHQQPTHFAEENDEYPAISVGLYVHG